MNTQEKLQVNTLSLTMLRLQIENAQYHGRDLMAERAALEEQLRKEQAEARGEKPAGATTDTAPARTEHQPMALPPEPPRAPETAEATTTVEA
jgi:hypothetical protein